MKNSPGSSKKTPAPTKKASILRKTGAKKIKKTMGKKGKEMLVKDSAKKTLGGTGKASAFDLEAFVKVKFSELEKTAHQKKVRKMLLSRCSLPCFRTCLDRPTAPWRS